MIDTQTTEGTINTLRNTKNATPEMLMKSNKAYQEAIYNDKLQQRQLEQPQAKQAYQARYRQMNFQQISSMYDNYIRKVDENQQTMSTPISPKPIKRNIQSTPQLQANSPQLSIERSQKQIELTRQLEEKFRQECSFKPKISTLPRGRQYNYSNTPRSTSREQWLNTMSRPNQDKLQLREKLKREQEEKEINQFNFKPRINQNYQLKRKQDLPVQERLYQYAIDSDKRQREYRQKAEQEANRHSYSPEVKKTSERVAGYAKYQVPLYMRIQDVQNSRDLSKERIRNQLEQSDTDLTFKPRINSRSQKLAENRNIRKNLSNLTASERLNREAEEKNSVNGNIENSLIKSQSESVISNKSMTPSEFSSFYERQMSAMKRIQQKRSKVAEEANKEYQFKPKINDNSKYMVQLNSSKQGESFLDRVNRMSTTESEKNQLNRSLTIQEMYGQYTFKPKINELSRKLAEDTSLDELAYNEKRKGILRNKTEERIRNELSPCTFKPKLNTNKQYNNAKSAYSQGSNILDIIDKKIRERTQKAAQVKHSLEFDELKSCTFKPEINFLRINTSPNQEVKGMERYMELQQMAKKKETERKEVESKVFLTNPKYNEQKFTIPKPFNLTPVTSKQSHNKVVQNYADAPRSTRNNIQKSNLFANPRLRNRKGHSKSSV